MPNWCSNKVRFTGDPQKALKLVNVITGQDYARVEDYVDMSPCPFRFGNTVPLAEIAEDDSVSGFACNSTAIAAWGTKWDAENATVCDVFDNGEEAVIYFEFDTAWSPPLEWIGETSQKYPDVEIACYYSEPGMNFEGLYIGLGGEVQTDISRELLQI